MQQTETYKLGLIETSDTFSPDTLNDNTRKVEEVLAAQEAEAWDIRQDVAALAGNLGHTYKNCRVAAGSYVGTGDNSKPFVLTFDFEPVALIIQVPGEGNCSLMIRPYGRYVYRSGVIVSGNWEGKSIVFTGGPQMNSTSTHNYVAFGYDE